MVPTDSSTLSVEARWCWISRTSQFHRRIRPGDSHASRPPRSALTLGATRARGEGPGPVPGHHRSQRAPPDESTVLDVVPFLALPRAWEVGSPLSYPRCSLKPSGQAPLQGLPWCRAGSRPSAPVMLTCPAPGLLKQAIQSPSRAQLVDHIPPTSRSPVVIISSSHQCQSFHKGLHKPLNRLRPVLAPCRRPVPTEDLDVLDIHLSCRLSVKLIRGQPVDGRPRTHVCVRPHTLRAVPLISGHQRPAAAGDFRPRIIYGQGQDTRAHNN